MKLISLNTWGGKLYKPLLKYIKDQSKDTDIFCFQEVFKTSSDIKEYVKLRLNLYDEISGILTDFNPYFAPTQEKYIFFTGFVDFDLSFGLVIFVRKNIRVTSSGDFFVFRERNGLDPQNPRFTIPRNLQYLEFIENNKKVIIGNFHGIWFPGPKTDSPSRIDQSKKIAKFFEKQTGGKILCGDFNLSIKTESLKILEKDMRNLIKEYKIPTTRSELYDRADDKFADYTFVSKDIEISNFQVPSIEVSDHLPMVLEFS